MSTKEDIIIKKKQGMVLVAREKLTSSWIINENRRIHIGHLCDILYPIKVT